MRTSRSDPLVVGPLQQIGTQLRRQLCDVGIDHPSDATKYYYPCVLSAMVKCPLRMQGLLVKKTGERINAWPSEAVGASYAPVMV